MSQNQLQTTTRFSLVPQNYTQAKEAADMFAKSGMVPKLYENAPNKIIVAWELGASLGLGLMQSLQGIAVINGNPAVWGDTALAVVRASGLLESITEEVTGKFGDLTAVASCTIKRKGENAITTTFSMQEAKTAGLSSKTGPWTQYPKRMLQLRARGFALRDAFADVLKGMKLAEEVQDYTDLSATYPNAVEIQPATTNDSIAKAIKAAKPEVNEPAQSPNIVDGVDQATGEVVGNEGDFEINPAAQAAAQDNFDV